MARILASLSLLLSMTLAGCASVSVTKTAKGIFEPTDPDEVEILVTVPEHRRFVEIATVSTRNWNTAAEAKMHNALRAKVAPLGANGVILRDSGSTRMASIGRLV